MAEGIELVSKLITRYAVIESLYLSVDSSLAEHLVEAIVTLYTAILRYLIQAQKYYQKRTSSKCLKLDIHSSKNKAEQCVPLSFRICSRDSVSCNGLFVLII